MEQDVLVQALSTLFYAQERPHVLLCSIVPLASLSVMLLAPVDVLSVTKDSSSVILVVPSVELVQQERLWLLELDVLEQLPPTLINAQQQLLVSLCSTVLQVLLFVVALRELAPPALLVFSRIPMERVPLAALVLPDPLSLLGRNVRELQLVILPSALLRVVPT